MGERAKKPHKQTSVYLALESRNFLKHLKAGRVIAAEISENSLNNEKETLQLSHLTVRVLELLQRDSTDQGNKKSKGWFIDQALQDYRAKKGTAFFKQIEQDQQTRGRKKSKSWFVEDALQLKYRTTYKLAEAATIIKKNV